MSKPKIFIGSSSKSLAIVDAYAAKLSKVAEVLRWDEGVFHLGDYNMEALRRAAEEVDFALLVIGQDDMTVSKGMMQHSPRDNVVFEAGLFTPVLGRARVFYSVDRQGSKMPSDWDGLGYTTYDSKASGGERVRDSFAEVRDAILRLGVKASNYQLWPSEEEMAFERGISGSWVDFITSEHDQSVVGHFDIRLERDGVKVVNGVGWKPDGTKHARFRSQSVLLKAPKMFYSWRGEHPRTAAHTGYFGAGEVDFVWPPESGDLVMSGSGKYSVTSEAHPEKTVLLWRRLERPSPQANQDLISGDPDRIGRAVSRLLEERPAKF